MRFLSILCIAFLPTFVTGQAVDGVLMRCGASSGQSYIFKNQLSPDDSGWMTDGINNGKIVLIRLGDEWDIQFDDSVGAYGYRQDGARVFPLFQNDNLLTVGAFGALYVDIFTFDFENQIVGWTTNKHGPVFPKVSAFVADCD